MEGGHSFLPVFQRHSLKRFRRKLKYSLHQRPGFGGVIEAGDEAAHGVSHHDDVVHFPGCSAGIVFLHELLQGLPLPAGRNGPGQPGRIAEEPELVVFPDDRIHQETVGQVSEGGGAGHQAVGENHGYFPGVIGFGKIKPHRIDGLFGAECPQQFRSVCVGKLPEESDGDGKIGRQRLPHLIFANEDVLIHQARNGAEGWFPVHHAVKVQNGRQRVHVAVVLKHVGMGAGTAPGRQPRQRYAHSLYRHAFAQAEGGVHFIGHENGLIEPRIAVPGIGRFFNDEGKA